MWKEYIPAGTVPEDGDADRQIEQYWTGIWKEKELTDTPFEVIRENLLPFLESWVAKRQEYRVIKPYVPLFPKQGKILDGGCGLGKWVLFWSLIGFEAVGIDISSAVVERLKKFFPDQAFVCGDIRKTGLPEESFDVYTSWGTFEHFEDGLGDCLREARRVLKKGGHLFVSVPLQNWRFSRRSRKPLHSWDRNFHPLSGFRENLRFHQWRLTVPELQREFELHGFRMVAAEPIHKKFGLHRTISEDLGLPDKSRSHKLLYNLLYPMIPSGAVSHMIVGVARKR